MAKSPKQAGDTSSEKPASPGEKGSQDGPGAPRADASPDKSAAPGEVGGPDKPAEPRKGVPAELSPADHFAISDLAARAGEDPKLRRKLKRMTPRALESLGLGITDVAAFDSAFEAALANEKTIKRAVQLSESCEPPVAPPPPPPQPQLPAYPAGAACFASFASFASAPAASAAFRPVRGTGIAASFGTAGCWASACAAAFSRPGWSGAAATPLGTPWPSFSAAGGGATAWACFSASRGTRG